MRLERKKHKGRKVQFKAYHLGEIKGTLSREEIYDRL